MKHSIINIAFVFAVGVLVPKIIEAQGFVNLDFEEANLSGYSTGSVPAADAIPGWTAYIGGTPLMNINYDVTSFLVGNEVDIMGPDSGDPAIQGNYYVYVQGSAAEPASIGQTGTIPATAQSLIFFGNFLYADHVSFDGQDLTLNVIGSGSTYDIYSANISAFAGQTGQLLFTSTGYPYAGGDSIDNIQFVPEPDPLSLLAVGSLLFVWHRCKIKAV